MITHIFGMINAFNCINNHVNSCINSMLSYDQSSPTIILEEDFDDEEAPDEESRAEPNLEVYKPLVPYPQLLSQSKVLMCESDE